MCLYRQLRRVIVTVNIHGLCLNYGKTTVSLWNGTKYMCELEVALTTGWHCISIQINFISSTQLFSSQFKQRKSFPFHFFWFSVLFANNGKQKTITGGWPTHGRSIIDNRQCAETFELKVLFLNKAGISLSFSLRVVHTNITYTFSFNKCHEVGSCLFKISNKHLVKQTTEAKLF